MLYGHSQDLARAMPLIRRTRPEYWKAIDPDEASAKECAELGVKLIVRHYGEWDKGSPLNFLAPDQFLARCMAQPWFPYAWAVETPNEPHYETAADKAQYGRWMSSLVTYLAQKGKECVVGNWGTGWDGYQVEGATYYGCHEYGWPSVGAQKPWHAERYKTWFGGIAENIERARLFITEFGVTRAVSGGPDVGFHTYDEDDDVTPEGYWGSIEWYLDGFESYVEGAFLFQVGGNPDWSTFEILDSPLEAHLELELRNPFTIPVDDEEDPEPVTAPLTPTGETLAALDVIWGWTNPLQALSAHQAVKEIRDAVGIIKSNLGKV